LGEKINKYTVDIFPKYVYTGKNIKIKPLSKKSRYGIFYFQRAADGGIAVI
jgi:hypothetical protein